MNFEYFGINKRKYESFVEAKLCATNETLTNDYVINGKFQKIVFQPNARDARGRLLISFSAVLCCCLILVKKTISYISWKKSR